MAREPFVWGAGGQQLTPQQVEDRRNVAQALMAKGADFSPAGHWTEALGRAFNGWIGGKQAGQFNRQEEESTAAARAKMEGRYGAVAQALAGAEGGGGTYEPSGDELRDGILSAAGALGMNPEDLATIISYETAGTFDPMKAGPTTQWGQHKGLIQFGEPQAAQYGVDWSNPVGSQLGADGAIVRYFTENGWKPGMGLLDAYSIVNAGAPGRYNASDAGSGGAPGTVADKVNNQMAGHRAKAASLLGTPAGASPYTATAPQGSGSAEIAALLADPWVKDQYGDVLGAEMQQAQAREMALFEEQRRQQDPMYMAQLEAAQLANAAAKQPQQSEYQERQGIGEMMGLEGSALRNFVLTGEMPAEAESFTLGEGQMRFDANGNLIAQGSEKTPSLDEYEKYVKEAQAKGEPVLDRLNYEQAKKGKGFSMTMPDGTVVQMGGAQGAGPEFNDTGAFNLDTVMGDIDSILGSDLSRVTGSIQGAGGNMVDELNWAQRLMAGEEGLATIERIGNLQNKTWMAARDMLKGGGSITDYESKKAEGAMARLSRVKGEEEMRAALKDLRDAVEEGKRKLDAAKGGGAPAVTRKRYNPQTGAFE